MLNVKACIERMTLEQKAAQLVQIPYAHVGREKAEEWARLGVGSFLHVFGEDARHLQEIAIKSGAKIPLLFGIDAVHGHCLNRKATVFPRSSLWRARLIRRSLSAWRRPRQKKYPPTACTKRFRLCCA